jgi:NAD(P)H-dependent FMN reductase
MTQLKKIIAFGASNSRKSINKRLATFAANQVESAQVQILDLNDFEMPIYSIDREKESGIPKLAHEFKDHVRQADGLIISFAEHNGSYTVAFKNVFDWISRIEKDVWLNKPMFLLSTSPGGRGGKSVLEQAATKFQRMNDNIVVHFSLPSFRTNFSEQEGVTDNRLRSEFDAVFEQFTEALHRPITLTEQ